MKLFRKRILKLGNKGLSMVELVCAIAIVGFLGTAISGMMVVSANSYRKGSSETGVQQEAQLVANQMSDLLIDAKSIKSYTPGQVEIELKDGTTNFVKYNSSDKKLVYVDATGKDQPMAQGVESFKLNDDCIDTFKKNGHVNLTINFSNNEQNYPAVFTITGRNIKAEPKTGDNPGTITLNTTEWLLEPNQSKDFSSLVSLTGVDGGLSWAVEGSNSVGGLTYITNTGVLTIGRDEMSSSVRVHVKSNKLDPSTGAPMADAYITVYVRRVIDLPLNIMFVPGSGTQAKAGAEYMISYGVAGNYLDKIDGAAYDDDYIDPRVLHWEISVPAGMSTASYTKTDISTGFRFKLNQDIPAGSQIVITAKAEHTYGTFNGRQANKSGMSYGDLSRSVTIAGAGGPFIPDEGWVRQSDKPQAHVDNTFYSALKNRFQGMGYYNVGSKYTFRFRKVDETTWDGWHENTSGDGNDSMEINLRPIATGIMDYRYPYEVQIRFSMVDRNTGTELWPAGDPTIPESYYIISNVVQKVTLLFTGSKLGLNEEDGSICCPAASAQTVSLGNNQTKLMSFGRFTGLEGKDLKNNVRFIFERKNGASWVEVNDNQALEIQNNQGDLYVTARGNFVPGDYRIKVWVKEVDKYKFGDNDRVVNDGKEDFILYDESTGEGIFYVKLER